MKPVAAILISSWALLALAGQHDYYECKAADGSVSYSVTRCAKTESQRRVSDDDAPTSQPLGGGTAVSQVVAGGGGHFAGMGAINGVPVAMMVDTGATDVSLSEATARQVGLDLRGGRAGRARTANGVIAVTQVMAASVTFAGQTVKGVSVDVRLGQQDPAVLLGMSFLQYFEMNIDGGVLSLRRK